MDNYPSRVTLFDDGVYRWSYDMDMWHNLFLFKLLMKVMGIIGGFIFVVFAVLLGSSNAKALVYIALGIVGLGALAALIYAICAAVMHGRYRLRFEMDDSAVALIQSTASQNVNATLSIVSTVASLASGSASAMRGTRALAMADSVGTTLFSSVRRVKLHPECDVIDLRELFGMNQIYVNAEDYPFVRDFIMDRVPERAK